MLQCMLDYFDVLILSVHAGLFGYFLNPWNPDTFSACRVILMFLHFQFMVVYLGISLIRRTLTLLVHAGLFRYFLNPLNSDTFSACWII